MDSCLSRRCQLVYALFVLKQEDYRKNIFAIQITCYFRPWIQKEKETSAAPKIWLMTLCIYQAHRKKPWDLIFLQLTGCCTSQQVLGRSLANKWKWIYTGFTCLMFKANDHRWCFPQGIGRRMKFNFKKCILSATMKHAETGKKKSRTYQIGISDVNVILIYFRLP